MMPVVRAGLAAVLLPCCCLLQADVFGAQDALAEIGLSARSDTNGLVMPQPPELPDRMIPFGEHDPSAAFQPADRMDTPEEMRAALRELRESMAPFFENHAPPLPSSRRIRPITTFDWRIATEEDWTNFSTVLAGAGEWQPVRIPHYGPPLGKTNTFYRTTFNLESWDSTEAVFVRFRGVDYKAHVFVNGAFVGSHEGFFAPFEFDITRCVKPGENTLFVHVENDFPTLGAVNDPGYPDLMGDKLYAATGPGYDDPNAGWHHCPPGMGIWQPVSIEVRPRLHVRDIFVRPLPDEAAAEAVIEVWNCDVAPKELEIHFSVRGLNFEQSVASNHVLAVDAAGEGPNWYRARFDMPGFRWWTPDAPWLYEFQATVIPKIGKPDHANRHFGMRTFRLDTADEPRGRFFLNGRELRLRGANTMGFEQQDVMRGDLDQLRDDLLLAKVAHINFLRITQRPVQEEVYDMADRVGLLIQTDFPLFGHMRPNQFAEGVRQAAEMERLIRSHPSCVLVSYINERFSTAKSRGKVHRRMHRDEMERFFAAMDQAVLSQNPDRVIKAVDGDYDPPAPGLPDNHCYTLWYFRNGIDIGLLHKGYWQAVKAGWNYACGEFGAEGLDRVELLRRYCPSNWLPSGAADDRSWTPDRIVRAQTAAMHEHFFDTPDSMEEWVSASREHQAWATRLMTEAFRRDNRMVSFAIHLFIDAWPAGWMKAIVDVEREPKPAFFAYREALTPLMANIRTDRWKFFSGERMRHEFWICNDTHEMPSNAELRWQLEIDGRVVHARRSPAEIRPNEAVFQGFTDIPVPEVNVRTKGTLRLALFDGERLVHDTAVELEFFPRPKPLEVAVHVLGQTDGPAARLARELNLPVRETGTVWLIDDFEAFERARAEVDRALEDGARVLFLNLPPGRYVLPGSSESVLVASANPHFLTRKTGHEWVRDFEPFDFRFWYDQRAGMLTPLASGKFTGGPWNPIVKAQGQNAVAERAAGRGRVILCQAFLADRVTANPTARLFVERLLRETRE
ncbi:MAG TPA: glycoside hydrolase family 2 [Verrucomicrobia bacterium]|nr:glycoside hydrolase family 2 [Verrucomicrobiota bacterium]HPU56073.1 glycoside hydrolase family 2 TIM barrel-domain containing protein [Verrucomicrobiota bacterium]